MCGIAGILTARGGESSEAMEDLRRMAAAIAHRGPDDEGFWTDGEAGVAFTHRRLSIVDLSPAGHQPMKSRSGRFTITFNGEIYNHHDLREELISLGHSFRGSSDTEVLLAACEQWGLESTLARSIGMFAFGLWDARDRLLHLARDRFGEKPLYYGVFNGVLLFGSELKSLRAHRAFRNEIDRTALAALLRQSYVPAPQSIFRDVWKVRQGSVLTAHTSGGKLQMAERAYYRMPWPSSPTDAHAAAKMRPAECVDEIETLLKAAIGRQMVADVPVGAFLSGGIDSSLVVALMQSASSRPVHTFSIGFEDKRFDEAPFARRVASHLGTQHTEMEVTARDALAVIPKLPQIYDEPFADSSQIPTFLVSQLARSGVTVSLSGDAGDELFGGYAVYKDAMARWQKLQSAPLLVRKAASMLVRNAPFGISERRKTNASGWTSGSFPQFYRSQISYWKEPERAVIGALPAQFAELPINGNELAYMMHSDLGNYVPDDILVKVDRAAMAVSLETRVPFLDHAVAEAAWRIPAHIHMHEGKGKWILREMLARHVPRDVFDRPKKGFSVPVADWLRGELKPWASELLDPVRLRSEGYFNEAVITQRWQEHCAGKSDWAAQLWVVLMFQSWLRA